MSAKRKTRSVVVRLPDFGAEETDAGFDLANFDENGTRRVVRVHFGNPSNAEWIANMALNWLEKRRRDTESAFIGIADRLKAARGQP